MAAPGLSVKLDTRVLDKISKDLPGGADAIIGAMAFEMEADVKASFGTGPAGRTYYHGSVAHVASAEPGPPAVDTGLLRASIKASRRRQGVWQVAAGTKYAEAQEFGVAPHLAARPYMRPAIYRLQKTFNKRFKGLIKT